MRSRICPIYEDVDCFNPSIAVSCCGIFVAEKGSSNFNNSLFINILSLKNPSNYPVHPIEKIIFYNCVRYSINTAAKATRPDNELEDAINNKPKTVTF